MMRYYDMKDESNAHKLHVYVSINLSIVESKMSLLISKLKDLQHDLVRCTQITT